MSELSSFDKANEEQILGHPVGLFICFFTEMWERFSFYGMKALLLFYVLQYHLFPLEKGNLLVGSYAAMVYAMPVIGGYLADKYLGFRKAVVFGGILLVLGHLGMVFEGNHATDVNGVIQRDEKALQFFYFSLALIVVGVGFLKANISSIVGELYSKNDVRKDSAFTIFYMGINLGSFLATLICGWLGETFGWGYGFGAAGIGMILGLITFLYGQKYFYGVANPPHPAVLKEKVFAFIDREWLIYIGAIISVFIIQFLIQRHDYVETILVASLVISLGMIIYYGIKLDGVSRQRLIALTILCLVTIIFWSLFEQAYTSLNLFASITDKKILFWNIKASQFLSLNALFIFILAPFFAWMWPALGKNNPNTVVKFGLALVFVGLGFYMLVLGGKSTPAGMEVASIWLVLCYMFHTIGELSLSPIGLSAVTKLSPGKIVGFMMGFWFLVTAFAEYVAGLIANIAHITLDEGKVSDISQALPQYINLFDKLFLIGVGSGIILLILSPFIKKLMHGIN